MKGNLDIVNDVTYELRRNVQFSPISSSRRISEEAREQLPIFCVTRARI
jgi:hypothetical protein